MRRFIAPIFAALALTIGLAVPAQANHCNWSCPTPSDTWEFRDTAKIDLGTAWRLANGTQDACWISILNDGTAFHHMRAQIIKRSTGTVIYDSGQLNVDPNEQIILNPNIVAEPNSAEIYVKGWNDVGNVTYDDFWFNVADDTNTVHSVGYFGNPC